MSFSDNKSNSQSASTGKTNSTTTPNNLSALQSGWNAAGNLLTGTNGNSTADANNGLALTALGANSTSSAANGGLTTATNFANGGTANGANPYITPIANGSQVGSNNPYFQNLVTQLSQSLQPQVDGSFGAAGRYGSGANANAFNTALTNETGQLGYTNYNDSLNRQQTAQGQLSTNNANSTNSALAALGLIPGLGTASTGAGAAAYGAGVAPTGTYANILSLLGSGGGTVNGTSSGTQNGSSESTGLNISPKFSLGPFSFGG